MRKRWAGAIGALIAVSAWMHLRPEEQQSGADAAQTVARDIIPAAVAQPYTQCIANASAGGTPNAITIPALPCGLTTNLLILTAAGANTITGVTLQPLGQPALTIVRQDLSPLQVGDISGVGYVAILSSTGSKWVLLNPANSSGSGGLVVGTTPVIGGTSDLALTEQGGVLEQDTLSQMMDLQFGNVQGGVLYRGAGGWAALAPGTSGNCLETLGAGFNPQWSSGCGSGGGGTAFTQTFQSSLSQFTPGTTTVLTLTNPPSSAGAGLWVYWDGVWVDPTQYTLSGSTLTFNNPIAAQTIVTVISAAPGGGVLGVAMSASPGSIFTLSGSPITSTGTLALGLATQNAHTVLVGPSSGSAAVPGFRVLVAGDLPSIPATSIPFTQTGTGAVLTSVGGVLAQNWLTVQEFGVDCTGATDSTTALTNAVAAAIAQGRPLQVCQGTIKVSESTGIPITGNLIVEGTGGEQSFIENTNTNGVVFSASLGNSGAYQFRHIGYTVAGTPTGGEFLSDNAATTENSGAKFIDFYCTNAFNCLDLEKSSHWAIDQTHFIDGIVNNAMVVQNTINQDSGDSVISNSEFFLFTAGGSCSGSTANGIFQEGSGGLKVTGTKFNCVKSAYWLDVGVSVSSSISVFTGDSLENCNNDCVILQPQSGGTWGFVVFTGDEIRPVTSGSIGIVVGGPSASWLNGLTVSGNSGAVNNAQFLNAAFGTDVALTGNSVGSDGGTATLAAWGTVSHCQSVGNATSLSSTGTCTP